ncbi:MAG TPA: hypothetical protein VL475_03155 [Planctomycetaceae bacterium]|jgi:hypothetical protein|nr:hypothetical protein [Planctomycetaceae bacterium]
MNRISTGLLHGATQVCLFAGAALVTLALSAILLPFALGVALLVVAQWAANREAQNVPLVVVPAGAY